jgi:hypothetical protein
MRSKVTLVSYLHSGVIDTAVHATAVSMTQLCRVHCAAESDFLIKTVCRIVREDIREKKLVAQRCATNFVDYLCEFEAIFEKAQVSGTQGKLFDEKNRGRVRVPLSLLHIKGTL